MIETKVKSQSSVRKSKAVWTFLGEKLVFLCGLLSVIVIAGILIFLLKDSLPVFKSTSLKEFLLGQDWYPLSDQFGILTLIVGSLLVTFGAMVIAVPLGIGTAIYIGELASPRVREILKPLVELLAAVPSVVWGFIGYLVLAPWIKGIFHLDTGLTALSGSITLAFMSLPTIVSISEDSLRTVPDSYKEASLSLGATDWQTIRHAILPAASSGIIAAIMLGVGRAIGETMAVLMVTGNSSAMPHSILDPVRTLTATIAAEMGETVQFSNHYYALFAIGTVLFVITFIINSIADLALRRARQ